MINERNGRLRLLPPVHEVVAEMVQIKEISECYETPAITWAVRTTLNRARECMVYSNSPDEFESVLHNWIIKEAIKELKEPKSTLRRVINATGVVLHTNCGRAPLAPEVADFVVQQGMSYSNLELDIETGERGSRYDHIQALLTELTGAEAAMVVNNNAAAVLLIMNTFANQREVIVSRGELVEVGGSFRIPEVLKAGGAKLVEVGATNKTWLKDYKEAVSIDTALFLKVHTSNYRIEGFQHAVPVDELVKLGDELGIPVMEDLGSGSFYDGADFGLPKEPTIQETVKKGAALVTFSGDKLLGGPQAGIIVGRKKCIELLKKNQLTRALRVDKLTLAALIKTLQFYQRGEMTKIPVWHMLSRKKEELQKEAIYLQNLLRDFTNLEVEVEDNLSRVGGGAFPTATLPTVVCTVRLLQGFVTDLEKFLRSGDVPILVRIVKDKIVFDPRTLFPEDYQEIACRLEKWSLI